MNKNTNNIIFIKNEIDLDLDDSENNKSLDINIDNELEDILKDTKINNFSNEMWINDNIYYTEEYTIKELLKICKYYGIDKNLKSIKCKKKDIISAIIFFENLPENFELVFQRNKMWNYMNEIKLDAKMKQYILWN